MRVGSAACSCSVFIRLFNVQKKNPIVYRSEEETIDITKCPKTGSAVRSLRNDKQNIEQHYQAKADDLPDYPSLACEQGPSSMTFVFRNLGMSK